MTKLCLCVISLFIFTSLLSAQISGYIIGIENDRVYIDLVSPQIEENDQLNVLEKGGFIIHPVTKKRIEKDPVIIGTLKVISLHKDYSTVICINKTLLGQLKAGMIVQKIKLPAEQVKTKDIVIQNNELPMKQDKTVDQSSPIKINIGDRIPVIVTPAEVNDIVGIGYFGNYVADMLMERLMINNKISLLDRSILNSQINEIDLSGSYIDPSTAIKKGKIRGAKYAIQVTMQRPDVVNVQTGVPLASIMGAAQMATGINMGAQYFSNTKSSVLKSSVEITARVIDMETSEVVFMCNGSGKAKGKIQIGLEYGALGGAQINGGVGGFKQTVTGKAIELAFGTIADRLNKFFNGETNERVLNDKNNIKLDDKLIAKNGRLYMSTQKLKNDDLQTLFANHSNYYFRYKRALKWRKLAYLPTLIGTVMAIVIPSAGITSDSDNAACFGAAGVVLIGGFAGTTLMCLKGNKELRKLADDFNQKSNAKWDLSLINSQCGIGLRLTF